MLLYAPYVLPSDIGPSETSPLAANPSRHIRIALRTAFNAVTPQNRTIAQSTPPRALVSHLTICENGRIYPISLLYLAI